MISEDNQVIVDEHLVNKNDMRMKPFGGHEAQYTFDAYLPL